MTLLEIRPIFTKTPLLPQSGDGRLLSVPTPAGNASGGGPLHDAEPLRGPGEEAGHAALPQRTQLPKRHLPVHTALQALIQRKARTGTAQSMHTLVLPRYIFYYSKQRNRLTSVGFRIGRLMEIQFWMDNTGQGVK